LARTGLIQKKELRMLHQTGFLRSGNLTATLKLKPKMLHYLYWGFWCCTI